MASRGKREAVDDILRRLPPQDIEAEQSVLGAILLDNTVLPLLVDILPAEDFYRESHREMYRAMIELSDRHCGIDAATMTDALRSRKKLEAIGGPAYIAELAHVVPTAANARHYARIVREKAALRRLASAATEIASLAYDGTPNVAALLEESEAKLASIAHVSLADPPAPLDEVAMRIVADAATNPKRNTVGTGFGQLDRTLKGSGLSRGSLITVAGATSVGKSAFALNLCTHASRGGSLYCSVEMTREELIERALSDLGAVDFSGVALRTPPEFYDTELERLAEARQRLFLMNLEFIDDPNMAVADVAAQARLCAHRWDGKLDLIVVDYLQILTPVQREDKRHLELAGMTKRLKLLAREMQVPVVLLSQLTREAGRRGGCPTLQELRDSGTTENDSDVVMFLWEAKAEKDSLGLSRGKAINLTIAKQRNGPLHTVRLVYEGPFFRFTEE